MKRLVLLSVVFIFVATALMVLPSQRALAQGNENACWGQATKVFAATGEMGAHSSQQPTPRLGLRNLARALYDQGVLAEPSMQALGAFVADAMGYSIEACQ